MSGRGGRPGPNRAISTTVVVKKEYRGQGIGDRLLRHLVQWGEGLGAAKLVAEIWDDDPEARAFAERRGFSADRHAFQSVLDLETAKPEILNETGLFERLEAEGIRIRTFAEEGVTEENEAEIYQVYLETLADIPGFMGEVPDREEWSKWHLRVEGYAPERVLLAVDVKDGRYAAVSNIPYKEATGGLYHEYTGVRREYRGRKIAQALKIRAVQLAKRQGAVYLKTDNDSLNGAILKVNQSLGYVPLRGSYRIVGDLHTVKETIANLDK
ncbi:GNAT family N-acetyltransferase [Cohnella sp. GCM10020058]|uniref:GNAT family N-acetyltransferase n=1 Tax=Cohnella sp. GCM10020058 TaxID=3317330 RepID=UPI00363CD954